MDSRKTGTRSSTRRVAGRDLPLAVELDGVTLLPCDADRQHADHDGDHARRRRSARCSATRGHVRDRPHAPPVRPAHRRSCASINAGSVGMPYESDVAAFWTLVEDGEPRFRRTPIDVERAVAAIRCERLGRRRGVRRGEPPRRRESRRGDRVLRGPAVSVRIGKVGRPHGLDGAFFVEEPSDDGRWFEAGATLLAGGARGRGGRAPAPRGRPVIRLDRPVERGAALEVDRDALPPTDEDEYYIFQLVGLEVVEEGGRALGRVTVVTPGVANDVLELDGGLAAADGRGVHPRRSISRLDVSLSLPASPTPLILCSSTSSPSFRMPCLAHRAAAGRDRARRRARPAALLLPRHDAASGRPGRRRALRRRRRDGAARRRRRGRARRRLRRAAGPPR